MGFTPVGTANDFESIGIGTGFVSMGALGFDSKGFGIDFLLSNAGIGFISLNFSVVDVVSAWMTTSFASESIKLAVGLWMDLSTTVVAECSVGINGCACDSAICVSNDWCVCGWGTNCGVAPTSCVSGKSSR